MRSGASIRPSAWPVDAAGGLIVAGMGGSAAGARLAIAALGAAWPADVVVDGYQLPGWAGESTLVFASSYSGNTEETLSAYDDAVTRSAPRLVATTGGRLASRAREHGVPVIPLPGGLPAARGDRLRAGRRVGGGPARRRRAVAAPRIQAAAALAAELVEETGSGRAGGQRGQIDRPRDRRHRAGDRRRNW